MVQLDNDLDVVVGHRGSIRFRYVLQFPLHIILKHGLRILCHLKPIKNAIDFLKILNNTAPQQFCIFNDFGVKNV